MGQKHLHELLGEDQEPFLLNSYIADRSFLVSRKPQLVKSQLQLKKQSSSPAPAQSSIFSVNGRKGSCFFSLPDSPDPRKSPICVSLRSPNSVFLHVPAKTAALLLEAALRIQGSSAPNKPTKPSGGLPGFRLFGLFLKRLTHRNWTEKVKQRNETSGGGSDGAGHCSALGFDAESSSDFEEEDDEEICDWCDEKLLCESPFRFVLQRSPPSGHRTPEISSAPASSPIRRTSKDKGEGTDQKGIKKSTVVGDEEEEEEKEQCSPVCVLDPPFDEDDEDGTEEHAVENNDSFDYEGSFIIVQNAKQQLLHKLFRFEKLAELDPVELEKRLQEQDSEEDDEEEEASKSSDSCLGRQETAMNGVCRRLEMWKEADFNKIDGIVERDLRRDHCGWIERDREQVEEVVMEIEDSIFGLMLEELMEDIP